MRLGCNGVQINTCECQKYGNCGGRPDWKVCKMRTEGHSLPCKMRTYTLAVSHLSHDVPQHLKSTQI